jgi:AcrR family transcriptional regulator
MADRAQWEEAALDALAAGGINAVAVEPLARRLGVTKGSFYWHFANREALVEAALGRWEQRATEAVIDAVAAEPDPRRRLRRLFSEVAARTRREHRLHRALAAATHPLARAVLARVTARRVAFLKECYRALGLPAKRAEARALLSYAAYLGLLDISEQAPRVLPKERRRLVQRELEPLLLTV